MKIVPWAITLCLLIAAAASWWGSKTSPSPPEPEPAQLPQQVLPAPSPDSAPKPSSEPTQKSTLLVLPDGFPKSHQGFRLESVKKQDAVDGVLIYFVARYLGNDDSEISVRLLSLDPATSEQFTKNLLKALVASESVKNSGVSNLAVPKGWSSSHLFSREDAGIYIAHNSNALVMVSAPTPDIAKTFGSALHLTPQ